MYVGPGDDKIHFGFFQAHDREKEGGRKMTHDIVILVCTLCTNLTKGKCSQTKFCVV